MIILEFYLVYDLGELDLILLRPILNLTGTLIIELFHVHTWFESKTLTHQKTSRVIDKYNLCEHFPCIII